MLSWQPCQQSPGAVGSITMSCSDPPCYQSPVFPGRMLRMVREDGPRGHHSISAALQCHLGWWFCYGNVSLLTTELSARVPKADQHSLHGNFCFPVMEARDLSCPCFSLKTNKQKYQTPTQNPAARISGFTHQPRVPLKSPCKHIFGGLFGHTEHFKCPVLNISGET